jgi:hypothetical protein
MALIPIGSIGMPVPLFSVASNIFFALGRQAPARLAV